jgi:hypothetical protein
MWAHHLLTFLWTYIYTAWTVYNDHIHRKDSTHQDTDLRKCLIHPTTHRHDKRSQVLTIHRNAYFMTDLDDTLTNTKSLTVLRNWLQLYEPAILNSIALATNVAMKNMKFLTQEHFTVLKQSSRKPKNPNPVITNAHTNGKTPPAGSDGKNHLRSIRRGLRPSSHPTPRPPALPPPPPNSTWKNLS